MSAVKWYMWAESTLAIAAHQLFRRFTRTPRLTLEFAAGMSGSRPGDGRAPLIRIQKEYVSYFNQGRPHTCTCAPVQVSGDSTTDTDTKGVTAWKAERGEGDGVPGAQRAAPRLLSCSRLGLCWPKSRRMKASLTKVKRGSCNNGPIHPLTSKAGHLGPPFSS